MEIVKATKDNIINATKAAGKKVGEAATKAAKVVIIKTGGRK